METMTPGLLLATVVIPVFNRGDLLDIVLDGLAQQTSAAFEVIVCDDGSTEDIRAVVSRYSSKLTNIKYVRQENSGTAAARNLGIRHAKSPIVIFLDSDVIVAGDVVENLVESLNHRPDWLGVEAAVLPVEGDDNVLWDAPVNTHGGVYLTAAIAYRRDCLIRVGGLDESFPMAACEDVELATRVLELGEIGFCESAVVFHPRRKRTIAYFWKRRQAWLSVVMLALRHGFVGWPENRTAYPRLRTAYSAVFAQPAGRVVAALRLGLVSPVGGIRALLHALVAWIAGVWMVPQIFATNPPSPTDYLAVTQDRD